MAVNEKVIYTTQWTCYGGKVYRPGEQLSGRLPDHALRGAMESGLTTDSHASAQQAGKAEGERKAKVQHEIETRSTKRDYKLEEDRRS